MNQGPNYYWHDALIIAGPFGAARANLTLSVNFAPGAPPDEWQHLLSIGTPSAYAGYTSMVKLSEPSTFLVAWETAGGTEIAVTRVVLGK